MFSLLIATVLTLSRCIAPTLVDTELPPQLPQPSVSDGVSLKLYRSPIPPCDEGVLTRMRQVFMRAWNLASLSSLSRLFK